MRHYLYKTTCLVNGKYYYGVHSERRKGDGYIGCGVCSQGSAIGLSKRGVRSHLVDSVVKYGYKNFKKEIICYFKNIEDAYQVEELVVDVSELNNPNCLNVRLGGEGGLVLSNCKKISILDVNTGEEFSFISQAECASFLGLKNISGKKRFCKKKYVLKGLNEPISLKDIDGNIFNFVDIYAAKDFTGVPVSRLIDLMNGNRNSANNYFISDFDFDSCNWQGVKQYRKGKY
jgi:hypothetical protein